MSNVQISVMVNGRERTAWVHVPSQHDPNGAPIEAVFCFHGGNGSGQTFAGKWASYMDSHYLLVFPDAVDRAGGGKRWIIPTDEYEGEDSNDDLDFVDALRTKIETDYNVSLLHATGFSSGGKMTWGLYAYRAGPFFSFAPVCRKKPDGLPAPITPRSALLVFGRQDPKNTPAEMMLSAEWLLSQWGLDSESNYIQARKNSCDGKYIVRKYGQPEPSPLPAVWIHNHIQAGHEWLDCPAYRTTYYVLNFIGNAG